MDNPETVNVTEALPALKPETRSKVKKAGMVGAFAFGVLLLADDQIKRFRNRKNVTVTVSDKDQSTTTPSS